jgi:hypothetical protein
VRKKKAGVLKKYQEPSKIIVIFYLLFEEEGKLHSQQRRAVIGLCRRLLDALHQQTATPHVQVGHHLHAMFALLVTRLLEEVVESIQSDVILGKVRSLQKNGLTENEFAIFGVRLDSTRYKSRARSTF